MSMSGAYRLELERRRQEQIRLDLVRAEARGLVAACEQTLRSVRDVAVQQLAGPVLGRLARDLAADRDAVDTAPDATLERLRTTHREIQETVVAAESRARAWSQAQAACVARARTILEASRVVSTAMGTPSSHPTAEEALHLAEVGRIEEADARLARAEETTTQERAAALDERVRRDVVRSLLKTLKTMGFVVVGPSQDAGRVILEGRLASGRKARFEIQLDGQMAFDLDGYEGRACAADLEKVETSLRDKFGVELGPPQVVWKNPDRISRSAQDLPAGATRRKG